MWAREEASRHWDEVRMVLTVTRQDSDVFIGVQATWWALPYRRFMRVVPLFCCTRVFTVSPCRLLMPGGSLKVIHSQHRVSSRHYASLISHRLGCSVIVSPARSLLTYSYLSAQQSWQDRCTTSNGFVHLSVCASLRRQRGNRSNVPLSAMRVASLIGRYQGLCFGLWCF